LERFLGDFAWGIATQSGKEHRGGSSYGVGAEERRETRLEDEKETDSAVAWRNTAMGEKVS